jgi:digeranylgeranylglycerophospholipid reductase
MLYLMRMKMDLKVDYDIVVIGGGPAGCVAAYSAAKEGASVLLLEKDRDLGSPVRCAEAVGKDGLEKILEDKIDPRWIAATIKKFQFIAPDGTKVFPQVPMTGYVLHRKLFDFDLGKLATQVGARIITKACVTGLERNDERLTGVCVRIDGNDHIINSKLIIGADGVESRVGRWGGIDTTIPMRDMETCAQMTLSNIDLDDDTCVFYFSQKKFPGGYGWVFPKGKNLANVGLGISGDKARSDSAFSRLEEFIRTEFPEASIMNKTIGGVPCGNRLPRITSDGILLVGDAALQANPVSGGGIATGMTAGKIAGRVAAEAINAGDLSIDFLNRYEKEWDAACGNAQKRYYRLKEGIKKLSDDQLNKTASALEKVPQEKQTLVKIFQIALTKQPGLLVDIVKTLSPFS